MVGGRCGGTHTSGRRRPGADDCYAVDRTVLPPGRSVARGAASGRRRSAPGLDGNASSDDGTPYTPLVERADAAGDGVGWSLVSRVGINFPAAALAICEPRERLAGRACLCWRRARSEV